MTVKDEGLGRLRSAVLVDVENMYLGLRGIDALATAAFVEAPERWLDWLSTLTYPALAPWGPLRREFLVRLCYLNPEAGGVLRGPFVRAGFQVVDCPSLTSAGKNAADIHMVIAMLDLLSHPTRFDEVVVLSSDADFTPALARLRAHDRRTVVVASGARASLMRAACDHLVEGRDFARAVLTSTHISPVASGSPDAASAAGRGDLDARLVAPYLGPLDDLSTAALAVPTTAKATAATTAKRPVAKKAVAPTVTTPTETAPEARTTAKKATKTLAKKTTAAKKSAARKVLAETSPGDARAAKAPAVKKTGAKQATATKAAATKAVVKEATAEPAGGGVDKIRAEAARTVRSLVDLSDTAVPLHFVDSAAREVIGSDLAKVWAGDRTLTRFLGRLDLPGLTVTGHPSPGYIYDPARHQPPGVASRS